MKKKPRGQLGRNRSQERSSHLLSEASTDDRVYLDLQQVKWRRERNQE